MLSDHKNSAFPLVVLVPRTNEDDVGTHDVD